MNNFTMADACCALADVWHWISYSQLFSTVIIVGIGTVFLNLWRKRAEKNRIRIDFLIGHIDDYVKRSKEYWGEHPSRKMKHRVCAACLKCEFSELLASVDDITNIDDGLRTNLRNGIIALYEATTGGNFESSRRTKPEDLVETISLISKHSASLRRLLRGIKE